MNIGVVRHSLGILGIKARHYAPEIMAISGGVGACVGFVMGCKAGMKTPEIVNAHITGKEIIESSGANDEEKNKAIKRLNIETTKKLVVMYGPAVTVFTLSIGSIFGSSYIFRKRSAEYAAAYSAVTAAYTKYRNRVAAKYGEAVDNELIFGAEEIETPVEGKKRPKKETVYTGSVDEFSQIFQQGCLGHTKDPVHNLNYVKSALAQAQDKLNRQGYLYLSDVYKLFGWSTITSKKAGWVLDPAYNPDGKPGYVDFGLDNPYSLSSARFKEGLETNVNLVFNCQPDIDQAVVEKGFMAFK